MFGKFLGLFQTDIGIDLGTANTVVYVRDQGIVLREPSVVAIKTGTKEVLAVGDEAKRMLGRTPANITAVRPLRDGVISDYDLTQAMLKHFIDEVQPKRGSSSRIRAVIAVPSGITEVEKRAVKEAATVSGANEVYLIEEPMAAAIGVGLPIQDASGNIIVDIGGGTTEVAVISLSGIVQSRSARVGGDDLDEAIIVYLRRAYSLNVGRPTAEEIKFQIGSAFPLDQETTLEVKGLDHAAGLPKTVAVSSAEIREAMSAPLDAIAEAVRVTLERCPPELAGDLVDRGIMIAGGGALLPGIDEFLTEQTGLPAHVADEPLSAVAEGTGKVLTELGFLKKNAGAPS